MTRRPLRVRVRIHTFVHVQVRKFVCMHTVLDICCKILRCCGWICADASFICMLCGPRVSLRFCEDVCGKAFCGNARMECFTACMRPGHLCTKLECLRSSKPRTPQTCRMRIKCAQGPKFGSQDPHAATDWCSLRALHTPYVQMHGCRAES
jgi:hypothetical protein